MAAARVAFTQKGHPSPTGTVRLVSGSDFCSTAGTGLVCEVAFSLFSGIANYKLELLDSQSHVTFTRIASASTSYALNFILANKFTSVALAFDDPVMGTPSQTNVQVTPYLQTDTSIAIPISADRFAEPIHLEDDDKSGATKLSTSLVYSSGQSVTLAYDGKTFVNPTIEAKPSPGGLSQRFVPILRSTEWALPDKRESSDYSGFGRMYLDRDAAVTFLAYKAIATIDSSGHIREQLLPKSEYDIALGADGLPWTILLSDGGSYALARVNADGSLTSFPLPDYARGSFVLGPDKQFWTTSFSSSGGFAVLRITAHGKIVDFKAPAGTQNLDTPTVGPGHSVWFAAFRSKGSILQVSAAGKMTAYEVPQIGNGFVSNLAWNGGRWLYAVASHEKLLRVSPGGKVEVFPAMLNMEDGSASPPIDPPLAFGPDGAMWYVSQAMDSGVGCNIEIGRVTTEGKVANAQLASACPKTIPATPTAFLEGPGNTLWYTRGSLVGKVVL